MQGIQLSFASMAVVTGPTGMGKTEGPLLELSLNVRVVAFPPLNVQF